MPEKFDPANEAPELSAKRKFLNQLYDKGPLVGVLSIIIICLYSWVAQYMEDEKMERKEMKQNQKNSDQRLEAYQKYVQGELFQKLDQSNRVIEKNTYVLEEISRKLDKNK